ncbi:MAG: membrane dipeptidase [Clostridiaceae bacterium]|nr:membrane dipeptidase [Clostridiaceae bacterium]
MGSIDMHCDTLMHAYLKTGENADIYNHPTTSVDFVRLRQGGAMAQFFAIFMLPQAVYTKFFNREPIPDETYIAGCAAILKQSIAAHSDMVAMATTASQIKENNAASKLSAVLSMEDGVAVQGKMENLDRFYKLGVRALSLTWNAANCFGAPNSKDPEIMARGLTDFGKEAVKHMQDIGMLVDVSHLSDGGFWDVVNIAKKPFAATHSNCRALCSHQRNMTDPMIRALADKGGVMGINFGPEFLNADLKDPHSTVARMVAMAQHEKQIGGIDVIGIGTDFDGIEGDLEIKGPDHMDLLVAGLNKGGFSDDEIEKIMFKNVLRVMQDAVK